MQGTAALLCCRSMIGCALFSLLSCPSPEPVLHVCSASLSASLFLFVFVSGGDLLLSVPNCAAFTASPRRWTRVPRVPHVRPRGRLAIPCRFSTIVIDRFSTIVIGTIVIVFINARRPSPWPEALRCESGQCDRLVERRLRISDCPLSQNGCCGGALNYHPTFFIFGNTSSDPTKHTPCPGPRPLTYAALDT